MHRSTTPPVWWLVGLTPVIMWLTHYVAVIPHEFQRPVSGLRRGRRCGTPHHRAGGPG